MFIFVCVHVDTFSFCRYIARSFSIYQYLPLSFSLSIPFFVCVTLISLMCIQNVTIQSQNTHAHFVIAIESKRSLFYFHSLSY